MKTEIIIYDNQNLYLDCLHYFLQESGYRENYDYQFTIEFEEIKNIISHNTSILIMDIAGLNWSETLIFIENILKAFENLKIIIISPISDVKIVKKFFDKGVKSFLTNTTNKNEFLEAINSVHENKVYINADAKAALLAYICNQEGNTTKKCTGIEELTNREKDVLHLLCEGNRTKEIADKLFISTHTVESHRRNIMLKLNVNNSSMLVKYAMDHNLVN